MEYILAFLISVLASIAGYYICKWLDWLLSIIGN